MPQPKTDEWFVSWFDSPYYHQLYQNRDEKEAQAFINTLVLHLNLPKTANVLDLACGKGRHSQQLHSLGYPVIGYDLSPQSIQKASENARPGLSFSVHDMRVPFPDTGFGAVFNLFTSMGYFSDNADNLLVLQNVYQALISKGLMVIDYLNATKVIQRLVPQEVVVRGDIDFHIQRKVDNQKIIKNISFSHGGKSYDFSEQVSAFTATDWENMLHQAGFKVLETFGSYSLQPFEASSSDRYIVIAQKI